MQWRMTCGTLVAAILLLAALSAMGSYAISRGQISAPNINLQIGPYHVLSRTTRTPNCHPLAASCAARGPHPAGAIVYYSVWIVSVSEMPIIGGLQEQLNSTQIVLLPIVP